MATVQELDDHYPGSGWPSSNITWSLHIQSDMYSRLAKTPSKVYPGSKWPLCSNWMATVQELDGHCPATGWPLSSNWMATVQQLDGHCPVTTEGTVRTSHHICTTVPGILCSTACRNYPWLKISTGEHDSKSFKITAHKRVRIMPIVT